MIRRSYHCTVCDHRWKDVVEKTAPVPDCPQCQYADAEHDEATERAEGDARIRDMVATRRAPAVLTHKSRAMDVAQKMSEDMGYTDMKDNTRAGEANFKPESQMTRSDAERVAREAMEFARAQATIIPASPQIQAISGSADPMQTFFAPGGGVPGAGPGMPPPATISAPTVAQGAAAQAAASAGGAAAEARAAGHDPIANLHEAGKKGLLPKDKAVGYCPMPTTEVTP